MDISVKGRKALFGGHRSMELTASSPSGMVVLTRLTDALLRTLKQHGTFDRPELLDLKGRDEKNLISGDIPAALKPEGEEVVLVAGQRWIQGREEKGDPFEIRLETKFSRFENESHIIHSLTERRRGWLPESVPLHVLGRILPVALSHVRIGLDLFTPQFIIASLGQSPVVSQTFLVEATTEVIRLRWTAEKLRHKEDLAKSPFFPLLQCVERVVGADLYHETSRRLGLS